ncbi:HipA N-terminal domain-containing protein [Marinobacter xiaoshiensis]|uniref:HipA N-terminal domain-containing protein n=1 Tax=Marinobacter xiaoshiensis TaxID=3073652 RepID=A0ABU2HJ92_9GAMM|nr:HipA N-terminal domain-containing protein [Marinobacter sp. F60267]MDS1310395.1 HipA N-terminal domain-containing protein [Marinobacter sp. F60267]
MNGRLAGVLERTGTTVTFHYDAAYLQMRLPPLSLSLPLRLEPYEYEGLPPYFSGLVSEGWLKRIQAKEQRIDPNDEFSLLVHNGKDLPGAVTLELLDMP